MRRGGAVSGHGVAATGGARRSHRGRGVGDLSIYGGDIREVHVAVDRERLEAYGVTTTQFAQALDAGNLNSPSGSVKQAGQEFAVRMLGEYRDAEDIRNTVLHFKTARGVAKMRVGELAQVRDTLEAPTILARLNGQPRVSLAIVKTPEANTVQVADAVKAEVNRLLKELPKDLEVTYSRDQSADVGAALEDVSVSFFLGILLVVLVVCVFLHNLRGMIIVSLAIPPSLSATFMVMYFGHFSLNQMTMLALSLVIGILVDDSIVVLENIFRHLHAGEEPRAAALNGRTEVGLAAVAITLTDVVVFAPIAFMGGVIGQFFREFGLTVVAATLFSLFVSFTLTPMLASRLYRRGEETEATVGFWAHFDRFYNALDRGYRRVLGWALHHRWQVVTGGVGVLLTVFWWGWPRLGFEFFPPVDQGQIRVSMELAPGARLEKTDQVFREAERRLRDIPEIRTLSCFIGFGGGGRARNSGMLRVELYPKQGVLEKLQAPFQRLLGKGDYHGYIRTRADQEVAAEIQQRLLTIPGPVMLRANADNSASGLSRMVGGGGFSSTIGAIVMELRGMNNREIVRVAEEIRDRMKGIDGLIAPDISWREGKPEVQARIDRVRAAEYGLSVTDIAEAMRDSLEGNINAKLRDGRNQFNIRVQAAELDRNSVEDVSNVVVGMVDGRAVRLRDVATLEHGLGPTTISRRDGMRVVSVSAILGPGVPAGNAQKQVTEAISDIKLGNVYLKWAGEAESRAEGTTYLTWALGLSIILVYLLMAALFESWLHPFTILLSLPMALVGAIIALVLAGMTRNIVSLIGFIMLVGLVTKNALLLVDYTNTLRQRGLERAEAILTAGPTRLRPILMTTLSMIFGMLPIALKLGRAAEQRAPLGVAVIGGLLLSTVLTLVVIPVVYTLFDDLGGLLAKVRRRGARQVSSDGEG
ncbi:MAG: efflux RND transporter permease subunit [Armatimonadetes bacterium]|nr:efflux RND transporter permease subunit [Armatimonadota bacterium]NCQ29937.1 efflux RND transporter permease subunit [Armatimonadota bacterium]NDK15557.1 efflux RND transporter permease subunit [Armatimonadota bacterium]PJB72248.1 MAG: AcrB/AcrD/AcrF family protein [Armatimonadetes bacterium CG_4_9_14_3_um_filter_66_14]